MTSVKICLFSHDIINGRSLIKLERSFTVTTTHLTNTRASFFSRFFGLIHFVTVRILPEMED